MNIDHNLQSKRNQKVVPHLEQYAPVWMVEEKFFAADEAIQFNVVFQHPQYGWVNRRYRYDGFNDVLYHKGQTRINEGEVLEIQHTEPYIGTEITDIPNSYGG